MWHVRSKLISEGGNQMGREFGNSQKVYTGIQEKKREMLQHSNIGHGPGPGWKFT